MWTTTALQNIQQASIAKGEFLHMMEPRFQLVVAIWQPAEDTHNLTKKPKKLIS